MSGAQTGCACLDPRVFGHTERNCPATSAPPREPCPYHGESCGYGRRPADPVVLTAAQARTRILQRLTRPAPTTGKAAP